VKLVKLMEGTTFLTNITDMQVIYRYITENLITS